MFSSYASGAGCAVPKVPIVAQQVPNLTSIHEDVGMIPNLTQWVRDLVLP